MMASTETLLADVSLHFLAGVCIGHGRLFVCDGQNGRVLSWRLGAQLSEQTTVAAGLAWPCSVCVGPDGQDFVAEESAHCITLLLGRGVGAVVCGSPARELGHGLHFLRRPHGVCMEGGGSLPRTAPILRRESAALPAAWYLKLFPRRPSGWARSPDPTPAGVRVVWGLSLVGGRTLRDNWGSVNQNKTNQAKLRVVFPRAFLGGAQFG